MSFLFAGNSFVLAQFTEVSSDLGVIVYTMAERPTGISTYDFNHDGWDDLTMGSSDNGVFVFQNNGGSFTQVTLFGYIMGSINFVQWVDIDNDGDEDFFAGREALPPVLLRNDEENGFTDISSFIPVPSEAPRSAAAAWGDYDNDGFLDFYLANYHMPFETITNWLFRNNGDGTFEDVTLSSGTGNGSLPSFQPTWIDIERDGDLDLYVVNDRFYGNSFYRNNGDGSFTDIAEELNCELPCDAMGVSWTDYEHDGDLDYYLTNTLDGNLFMKNTGASFENIADDLGVDTPGNFSWGVQFIDCDNDSDEDLYVATAYSTSNGSDFFFDQLNDTTFESTASGEILSGSDWTYAAAEFDFDNNGASDMATNSMLPFDVSIWQNTMAAPGNWIKIGLQGVASNYNAIGTEVNLFVNGDVLTELWMCGEGFTAQCSQYEIFGLDDAAFADSLIIHWPSGWVDHYYNLSSDQFYAFIEGATNPLAEQSFELSICPGGNALLDAGNYSSYLWSDGSTAPSLQVYQPGSYEVYCTDDLGFTYHQIFQVSLANFNQPAFSVIPPSCHNSSDGQISIEDIGEGSMVNWFDGNSSWTHTGLEAGIYYCHIINEYGCSQDISIVVTAPAELSLQVEDLTYCSNNPLSLNFTIAGGSGIGQIDWQGLDPNNPEPGIHEAIVSDENQCIATAQFEVVELPVYEAGVSSPVVCYGESTGVEILTEDNMPFEFVDNNLDLSSLYAGNYLAEIIFENGCSTTLNFEVEEYPEIVITHEILTDGNETNLVVHITGGNGPYSVVWNTGETGESIYGISAGNYTCLVEDANGCSSEYACSITSADSEPAKDLPLVYPQPCTDYVFFSAEHTGQVHIYDAAGRLLYNSQVYPGTVRIDTSSWASGIYSYSFDGIRGKVIKTDK